MRYIIFHPILIYRKQANNSTCDNGNASIFSGVSSASSNTLLITVAVTVPCVLLIAVIVSCTIFARRMRRQEESRQLLVSQPQQYTNETNVGQIGPYYSQFATKPPTYEEAVSSTYAAVPQLNQTQS